MPKFVFLGRTRSKRVKGMDFPSQVPVQVEDADIIRLCRRAPYFREVVAEEVEETPEPKRRRGRPPKAAALVADHDAVSDVNG